MARVHGFSGGSRPGAHERRRAARPRASRTHRPRASHDRRRGLAHPGENRKGRRRCVRSPPGAAAARLAADAAARRPMTPQEVGALDPPYATNVDPHEYCQNKAAQSGSSFYYSFLFLPEERRRAITALYAYCREVDDVVDETSDAAIARAKLAWWRKEVESIYHGQPQHPVARALAEVVGPYGLEEAQLREVIDGMAMDLEYNAYPDFEALKVYCHRVAGVVGILSAKIFGYQNPQTLDYAQDLGLAFQLTNIIRDVGEDVQRNRIYVPLHELAEYGVT